MPGHIEYHEHFRRAMIRARPKVLYAFGDNLARAGYGGQAKEARDEPNAVGVPTKRAPSWDESAFYTEADIPRATGEINTAFNLLEVHLHGGGTVVFPQGGLGTGRAELAQRVPELYALIIARIKRCQAIEAVKS